MHLRILAVVNVLAGIASTQSLAGVPDCATACVSDSLPASCNLAPSCICTADSFLSGISCCVFKACDANDQQSALAYAHGICDPVGASSLLPSSAGCPSTSGSASATGGSTVKTTSGGSASSATGAAGSASASASSAPAGATASAATASATGSSSSALAGGRLSVQGAGLSAVGAAFLGLAAFL
ncbi:hypothetical protein A1O3_08824 [Capronia epimyces CBS 606.96]|uniref:CFEM domain-containing protein n=1 Tax=Capronia epimyces CBS 606.96 TaxID=1182542 RepID=W9XFP1_9EURO|nr:uncharacterized protein A1O3_08824 [Capronia epimyces CBS 606.96]EXJ79322.1 hypothetical protein A1O3_08824 [Capronia epimyces CBS 606.96]